MTKCETSFSLNKLMLGDVVQFYPLSHSSSQPYPTNEIWMGRIVSLQPSKYKTKDKTSKNGVSIQWFYSKVSFQIAFPHVENIPGDGDGWILVTAKEEECSVSVDTIQKIIRPLPKYEWEYDGSRFNHAPCMKNPDHKELVGACTQSAKIGNVSAANMCTTTTAESYTSTDTNTILKVSGTTFEPSLDDLCRELNRNLRLNLVQQVDIPDRFWNGCGSKTSTVPSNQSTRFILDTAYICCSSTAVTSLPESVWVRGRSVNDGKFYDFPALWLVQIQLPTSSEDPREQPFLKIPDEHLPQHPSSIRLPTSTDDSKEKPLSKIPDESLLQHPSSIRPTPPPPCPSAQLRSDKFATIVAERWSVGDQVWTLDAYLRNTMALIDAGIPAYSIVVCERNPLVCLYQQLAIRGTCASNVRILYSSSIENELMKLDSSRMPVAVYLDYCGDIPSYLPNLVHHHLLPNLKVLAVTRAYRNVNPNYQMPELTPTYQFESLEFRQRTVRCVMWYQSSHRPSGRQWSVSPSVFRGSDGVHACDRDDTRHS